MQRTGWPVAVPGLVEKPKGLRASDLHIAETALTVATVPVVDPGQGRLPGGEPPQ